MITTKQIKDKLATNSSTVKYRIYTAINKKQITINLVGASNDLEEIFKDLFPEELIVVNATYYESFQMIIIEVFIATEQIRIIFNPINKKHSLIVVEQTAVYGDKDHEHLYLNEVEQR